MDWTALYKTLGLCLISILIEGASYSKSGKVYLEGLKKPPFAISMKGWYFVGSIYYLIFGIIGYRLFAAGFSILSTPVILLTVMMILNGFGNFVIFKWRSTKWFYLGMYPFAALLLTLIIILAKSDLLSAGLASLYFLWLIYDLYYGYQIWKLNP